MYRILLSGWQTFFGSFNQIYSPILFLRYHVLKIQIHFIIRWEKRNVQNVVDVDTSESRTNNSETKYLISCFRTQSQVMSIRASFSCTDMFFYCLLSWKRVSFPPGRVLCGIKKLISKQKAIPAFNDFATAFN